MARTGKFRKASGVTYPNAYASHEQAEKDPNAYKFNCGKLKLVIFFVSSFCLSPLFDERHGVETESWHKSTKTHKNTIN
jgi:hypothetical protein